LVFHRHDSLECLLTKNYGWLSTVGFSNFPDTLSTFQLTGFPAPEFGENDVTFSDVYDFQIGDIFHYEARKNGVVSFGFDQVTFDARRVIGIQFSTNGDTLSIDYDRNFYYHRYTYGISDTVEYAVHDTLTQSHHIPDSHSFLNVHPYTFSKGTFSSTNGYCWLEPSPAQYNGRGVKTVYPYYTPLGFSTNTYGPYVGSGHTLYQYGDGIGLTYREGFDYIGEDNFEKLVYFNKHGEEWGTPIDWTNLNAVGENTWLDESSIYPTLAWNEITISISAEAQPNTSAVILSINGKLVKSIDRLKPLESIDTTSLSKAVYFIQIINGKGTKTHRFVKL
jgi:hypothetical protein